jgi:hypothetical protein
MAGHNFGQLHGNTKKTILEIMKRNPETSSREMSKTIMNEMDVDMSVMQVASVRRRLGQHGKKWLKRSIRRQ